MTSTDTELLARILQEVVDLKSKNAQLEHKIDSLTATAAVGSPHTRALSAAGLTPVQLATTVATAPPEASVLLASSPPPQPLGPSALAPVAGSASPSAASQPADPVANFYSTSRVILTTYPGQMGITPLALNWGHPDPQVRGPVLASRQVKSIKRRNAIGAYYGSYQVYRALACATGALDPTYRPDYAMSEPTFDIPPQPAWGSPDEICTLDPWGAYVPSLYKKHLDEGLDVRPTIAATKAHIKMPELDDALKLGRLKIDGDILVKSTHLPGMDPSQDPGCEIKTSKIAIDPVWYLPGIARRLGVAEGTLRRALFEEMGAAYPELLTRHDLNVFLPPISGTTVYIFGDPAHLSDPSKELTARVHDECSGSDVFGSDICSCRPYLLYGIEEAAKTAQRGGVGLIVYFRKEGRALGEVTKYLVYNVRKRTEDLASQYFQNTVKLAGVKDNRFQPLMSDVLVWLGVKKINNLISMSDMKYNAITKAGIEVINRYEIPDELLPADSHVEIDAKIQAGYYSSRVVTEEDLHKTVGRGWENLHQ